MVLTVLVQRAKIKKDPIYFDNCFDMMNQINRIYFDPKDPEKPFTGAKSENGTEWWLIPQIKRGIVF